jgi:hypothetical protein
MVHKLGDRMWTFNMGLFMAKWDGSNTICYPAYCGFKRFLRIKLKQEKKWIWANIFVFVLDGEGLELGHWSQEVKGWETLVLEFEIPTGMRQEPNNWVGFHVFASTEGEVLVDRDPSIEDEDREKARDHYFLNRADEIPDGNFI